MRREESSNFLAFLVSLLIFLFVRDVQARKLLPIQCSTSCGDIKNIKYPFRLKGDTPLCGDTNFELSCSPSNKTILEYYSRKYYVKRISYDHRIITVVDVNLANGSCGLPQKSLSDYNLRKEYKDDRYYIYGNITYANFVRCSSKILHPTYRKLPCLNIGNQSDVYVTYPSNLTVGGLLESCSFISMVPVNASVDDNPSNETIQKLLQSGFDLKWSAGLLPIYKILLLLASYLVPGFISTLLYFFLLLGNNLPTSLLCVSIFHLNVPVFLIARLILVILLVVFLIHKYKTTKMTVDNVEKFLYNQRSWMPKRYSFVEIIAITNHFGDKLGQGGFGSVYKGQLFNGSLVAVKVLANSKFSGEEFINEVSTIGIIHHTNVVRLLGFCSEGSKRALVYEYMPNGSLDRHIFSKKGNDQAFRWERLHEIALGTARGIEYLHNGCDVCILHFDIKPHNILLDHNFIPKVADFGLAKFHPKENDFICMSATRGTIGYIAPELISRNFGIVSCKSDVYSFGMLLLEMAGGRRNSFAKATRSSKAYFPSWVYDQMIKGGDLELRNVSEIEGVIARKLCIIGLWCIQMKATDRPSITKVVEMLEGSIDDLQMPPKPCFASSSSSKQSSIREIQSDSSTELLESESIEECSNADTYDV